MSGWIVPVYREPAAWSMNPWAPMVDVMRDADRMRRQVESLLPFYQPGMFQPQRPPSDLAPIAKDGKYRINIAAQDYRPNEVTVKTVERDGKKFLVAEGKHETKDDAGFHSVHHFKRQFMIPDNVKAEEFTSKLSADGTLTIEAPELPDIKPAIKDKTTLIPVEMEK